MDIFELLGKTVEMKASDLHLTVALPPIMRISGKMERYGDIPLNTEEIIGFAKQMLNERQLNDLEEKGETDLSFSNPGVGRFRVNVYKQRGSCSMAIRVIAQKIPNMEELGLPSVIKELAMKKRGLVLVTGPTGSGKSTTLAAMIDAINRERSGHILTLEDPIEYLHKHNNCMVNQREIGSDSRSFANALRAALRQDPDVILVGEMRDLETISIAITAAETGHLVLSTLHTIGATKTVDRIIDVFPPDQQQQVRIQLSGVLEGVISQQLLPKVNQQGRVVALEIMVATPAIRNLIREGKTHQMQTSIQTGMKFGMTTMDASLSELYRKGLLTRETALNHAVDREMLERLLGI